METSDLNLMSVDELWNLHQKIATKLAQMIPAERARLEERLRKIEVAGTLDRVRRPYPPVVPKYQNRKNPVETWSGRGRPPRWLAAQLRAGKKLDDFLIDRSPVQTHQRTG